MRHLAALLMAALLMALLVPVALANEISFETPTADARIGVPVTFRTELTAAERPARVELVLSSPREEAVTVLVAEVTGSGTTWQATVELFGHTPPNTVLDYQFRARGLDGWVTGPQAQVTVVHDRLGWRTVEGPLVRLHWYEGDDAFAQRALEIGESAVARASALLGVTEDEPIDFFIYPNQTDMYEALGAGTRENVGGQAHAEIRTMFGLIEPNEINSDWVDTLVAHELTHLVFDTATRNSFRSPPRWLNEGVAVYLSEGYTGAWRQTVEQAAQSGSLIPLDGLAGLFPTPADQFRLAYGESVSAVDYFVRTFDEERLWQLVRSYARGVSDDEAFLDATGADLAAFNAAWMGSLGADVPEPLGPRPAPTGPVPTDWHEQPGPTLEPGVTAVPGTTTAPGATAPAEPADTPTPSNPPAAPGSPAAEGDSAPLALAAAGVGLLLGLAILILVIVRRQRRSV